MFINSKKSFGVREKEEVFFIPKNYIGEVPAWVSKHWMIQAAIADGSIVTPKSKKSKDLEKADAEGKNREGAAAEGDGDMEDEGDENDKG